MSVYSTTLWGDSMLLASTSTQQPTIWSEGQDEHPIVGRHDLRLEPSELKEQVFIGVYALKASEVILGVSVLLTSDSSQGHAIPLQAQRVQ